MRVVASFLILLLLAPGGCTRPPRAVLPPIDDSSGQVPEGYRILQAGANVKITTKSGDVMFGEVKESGAGRLVLGQIGNYGYVEKRIQAEDISTIELNSGETVVSAALKVSGIVVGTVVLLVVGFVYFGDVGMN